MSAEDEEQDASGFKKPHKLTGDDDLVAYFLGLTLPLGDGLARVRASTASAPSSFATLGEEERMLAFGAHREARGRHASLAAHKKCSVVVEALLQASTAAQVVRFWEAIAPYGPYLSCNRFSSHVLQTLLGLAAAYLSGARAVETGEAAGLPEEAIGGTGVGAPASSGALATVPGALTALASCALGLLTDLTPHLMQLLYDESATHVVRALVGLLSGAAPEPLALRDPLTARSEGKKAAAAGKSRKRPGAEDAAGVGADGVLASAAAARSFHASIGPELSATFRTALSQLSRAVCELSSTRGAGGGGSDEELGAMACDANASPTLQLLLRATCAAAPASGRYLARRLGNFGLEGLTPAECDGTADTGPLLPPPSTAGGGGGAGAEGGGSKSRKRPRSGAAEGPPPPPLVDPGSSGAAWLSRLLVHAIGSRLVEALVLHADAPLFALILQTAFVGRLLQLSLHPSANFVVQRCLTGACGNGTATMQLLSELTPHVATLTAARREGVVRHLVLLAATLSSGPLSSAAGGEGASSPVAAVGPPPMLQRDLVHMLAACAALGVGPASLSAISPSGAAEDLAAALAGRCDFEPRAPLEKEAEATRVARVSSAALELLRPHDSRLVRWWLNVGGGARGTSGVAAAVRIPSAAASAGAGGDGAQGGRVTATVTQPISLSPTGGPVIAACLTLSPSLVRHFVDSLAALPPGELACVAGDPFGSRHLIEPLIHTPTPELAWARAKLFATLKPWIAPLAAGRFGCWVVSKLFAGLEGKKKVALAAELVAGERLIGGTPGGRQVLRGARLEHFKANPTGWEASWARVQSQRELFADFLPTSGAAAVSVAATAAAGAAVAVTAHPAYVAAPAVAVAAVEEARPSSKMRRKAARAAEAAAAVEAVEAAEAAAVAEATAAAEMAAAADAKAAATKAAAVFKAAAKAAAPLPAPKAPAAPKSADSDSDDSSAASESELRRDAQAAALIAPLPVGGAHAPAVTAAPPEQVPHVRRGAIGAPGASEAARVSAALATLLASSAAAADADADADRGIVGGGVYSDDEDEGTQPKSALSLFGGARRKAAPKKKDKK